MNQYRLHVVENCIADFNGAIIGENMVAVIREKSKEEMEKERECTIFVKGVNPPLSLSSVETVISEYACVKSIFPLFINGAFRGSVCVIVDTPEEADTVESILDGATIDGVQIEIGHFDTTFKEKQKRNCFVTGIPLEWSQEDIVSLFGWMQTVGFHIFPQFLPPGLQRVNEQN